MRAAPWMWLALCAALCLFGARTIDAHDTGASYLRIDAPNELSALQVTWDVPMGDLASVLDLDTNNDAQVSQDELSAAQTSIARRVGNEFSLARGGAPCEVISATPELVKRGTEPYASLRLEARCPQPGLLDVSTRMFFGHAAYTVLLDATIERRHSNTVLSPESPRWRETPVPSLWNTFSSFLVQGTLHVLIGYDHIAFLLLLLLPSVLRRTATGWQAIQSWREVARDLLKIVTAFTIAHSITLGLAASGLVRLPVRPVEVAIAASIVIAGLLNLFPAAARGRLLLAFGFGFVHGFGFANALAEIGAQGVALAPMLAGFNIGVELAQLMIVSVVLPVLLALSRFPIYSRRLMPAMSLLTAVLGAFWLVARL